MKQRLGLAAALLGEPRILVLDEPANGLDPAGIRWLRDLLRSLANGGRSILISSHVLAEVAAIADEAVVINHGRSVTQASIAELTSGGAIGLRIAGPDAAALAEALRSEGATVEAADSGTFVGRGKDGRGDRPGRRGKGPGDLRAGADLALSRGRLPRADGR